MADVNYRLDEHYRLVDPVIGDAEIRGIQFEHPNMRLHIVQPFDGSHIELLLSGLIFLSFQTDHPQNVINGVFIYTTWDSARFPSGMDPDEHAKRQFAAAGQYVIVTEPLTGGPLVCAARDLSVRIAAAPRPPASDITTRK